MDVKLKLTFFASKNKTPDWTLEQLEVVLEHLKNAVSVQVESAKGNLLQPSKVSIFLKPFLRIFLKKLKLGSL